MERAPKARAEILEKCFEKWNSACPSSIHRLQFDGGLVHLGGAAAPPAPPLATAMMYHHTASNFIVCYEPNSGKFESASTK